MDDKIIWPMKLFLTFTLLLLIIFGAIADTETKNAAALQATAPATQGARDASQEFTLLVTNSTARHISFVDPANGSFMQLEVGAAPWGLALAADGRAYVATAEGVAVVDVKQRRRTALIPYQAKVGTPQFGEYRPGGMGIAVSPDGKQVYVGIYLTSGPNLLEIIDTERRAVIGSVPVGIRPFQLLVSRDGREVYSIDHDSYSVTVVDPVKMTRRVLEVAPRVRDSFDKPHYAAIRADGKLLLPIQGNRLVILDPASGQFTTSALSANTHQHGVFLTPDERRLFIVGTGPAGSATGPATLTILDLEKMTEANIPLSKPHENVVISPDGRYAYVTGGYTFAGGGWDGITVVDLETRTLREIPVPARPLDIVILR
jgi:YVTN family beta-propeller protein